MDVEDTLEDTIFLNQLGMKNVQRVLSIMKMIQTWRRNGKTKIDPKVRSWTSQS